MAAGACGDFPSLSSGSTAARTASKRMRPPTSTGCCAAAYSCRGRPGAAVTTHHGSADGASPIVLRGAREPSISRDGRRSCPCRRWRGSEEDVCYLCLFLAGARDAVCWDRVSGACASFRQAET